MTYGRRPLHSTLPLHRSPCRRAGGSGGPARSRDPLAHALDRPHARRPTASRDRGRARAAAAAGARRRTTASRAAARWAARAGRSAAARRPPKRVGAGRVHRRRARGRAPPRRPPRPRSSHSSASSLVRDAPSTSGTPSAARLAEPAQPGRLGRVLAGRRVRARLHERAAAVLELGRVGVVDVAAADPPQRPHGAAGGTGDGRLEAHAFSAARSSSSSPRQAASTMSSTVSNPRSPP